MKRSAFLAVFFAMFGLLAEEITVSDVTIAQNPLTRMVTVDYRLDGEPAIVTVDFMTNNVSIGEENFRNVFGDVNRVVDTNGVRRICWRPDLSLAGNSIDDEIVTAKVTAWTKDDPPDYLVVDFDAPSGLSCISYYVSTNALPDGGLSNDVYRTSRIVMRRIHAAGVKWQMGATKADFEQAEYGSKSPGARETAHNVTLTYDYFIGVYPITQEQYRRFRNASSLSGFYSGYADSALRPMCGVNYNGLRGSGTSAEKNTVTSGSAIGKLRAFTSVDFDLPTDAEWEYACKAGTTHLLYSGAAFTAANVAKLAWYSGNSDETGTHPVGLKLPNAWGLYDMIGNTLEWCRDYYVENLGTADVVDPIGKEATEYRVVRGSRHNYNFTYSRTTYRMGQNPGINTTSLNNGAYAHGFRVVCPLTLKFPVEETAAE